MKYNLISALRNCAFYIVTGRIFMIKCRSLNISCSQAVGQGQQTTGGLEVGCKQLVEKKMIFLEENLLRVCRCHCPDLFAFLM